MKATLFVLTGLLFFASCKRDFDAPIPDTTWDLFASPEARLLPAAARVNSEGIYTIAEGNDIFGNAAALKWTYTARGADTVYYLSAFCEKDVVFMVLQGRQRNGDILLNGYWRRKINTETGFVRLTIAAAEGARALLGGSPASTIVASGVCSRTGTNGLQPLRLVWNRPLFNNSNFEILAHRGGGRNADLLPASENSLEMLQLASQLGATGVEIDVRRTSDNQLILYHDATLNERLIQKNGMVGPIENYSYAQLNALVQLDRGGKIPTLRQALTTILEQTPLRFVWLDTKYAGPLQALQQIQSEFLQQAAARGRHLQIVIGIPDEEVLGNFRRLDNFQNLPALCELDAATAESINARIWAPTWTLGLQNEAVARMQAQGRKAFVWTLDSPERIQQYLNEGRFNGILSNQPSAVAYYFYAKQ